jgi:hypothetical protein
MSGSMAAMAATPMKVQVAPGVAEIAERGGGRPEYACTKSDSL